MLEECSQPARAAWALPELPPEILVNISRYIDRSSAAALTVTCKALRDAGETKLYHEVDLTSGHSEELDHGPKLGRDELPDKRLEADYARRLVITLARCRDFLSAISAHAPRLSAVRRLRLEITDGRDAGSLFLTCLEHVAPQLEYLDMITPTWWLEDDIEVDDMYHCTKTLASFVSSRAFCAAPSSFPNLRTLRMVANGEAIPYVPDALCRLASAGRLQNLTICSGAHGWWMDPDVYELGPEAVLASSKCPLSRLSHLSIDNVDKDTQAQTIRLLTWLLNAASNVKSLCIIDGKWTDIDELEYDWLASRPQLSTLIFAGPFNRATVYGENMFSHAYSAHIKRLAIHSEKDEVSELYLRLRPPESAEYLTIMTEECLPLSEYSALAVQSGPPQGYGSSPMAFLDETSYDVLVKSPNLKSFLYIHDVNELDHPSLYKPLEDIDYFVPATR